MSMRSMVSIRQTTALEVCDLIYANGTPPTPEALERIYESNAVYENPLLTAPSRTLIADLTTLGSQWSSLSVPRPLAALYSLLGLQPPKNTPTRYHLLQAWTELGEVWESESFDGHERCIVEHTLHVLLLPGIHTPVGSLGGIASESETSLHLHANPSQFLTSRSPALPVPFTSFAIPSPLHATLAISSRLTFNDAGKITYHRDTWDARDLVALLPGGSLLQWATSRAAASALGVAGRLGSWAFGRSNARALPPPTPSALAHREDREYEFERGRSNASPPAQPYSRGMFQY